MIYSRSVTFDKHYSLSLRGTSSESREGLSAPDILPSAVVSKADDKLQTDEKLQTDKNVNPDITVNPDDVENDAEIIDHIPDETDEENSQAEPVDADLDDHKNDQGTNLRQSADLDDSEQTPPGRTISSTRMLHPRDSIRPPAYYSPGNLQGPERIGKQINL